MVKASGLRSLLYALPIVISSIFPAKLKAQDIVVNPFVANNDSTLNWYGSGDVNNDKTVNWDDVSEIQKIMDGDYVPDLSSSDPAEYRTLDRADVNGDGVVNSEDKELLESKLNGNIEYLPGYWNKLKTKEERESWLKRMLKVDKTDEEEYIPGDYVCGDFSRQTMLNFRGFGELGYDESKGLRNNGRFNIPMNPVNLTLGDGESHAIDMTITENNLGIFEDEFFSEPQTDSKVEPGMWDMPNNTEIIISYPTVMHSQSQGDYFNFIPIQKFKIENGIVTNEGWENPDPNVKVINERDTIRPKIDISSPLENYVYEENPHFSYEIDEKNPGEMWYSLDNGKTKNAIINLKGGEILDLENGEYDLIVYAKDLFGNENSDTVSFSIDKSTGLESKLNNSDLKVYPNPVRDYLHFKTEKDKEAELSIYSINGKEIKKIRDFDGQIDLDMKEYSPGIYLYRYKNSDITKTGKIVKK